jgi:hypothetical protein
MTFSSNLWSFVAFCFFVWFRLSGNERMRGWARRGERQRRSEWKKWWLLGCWGFVRSFVRCIVDGGLIVKFL